ncbi:MAG: hypothetical protein OXG15_07385, partial [Gammaproteobacteria bacterium]|nr:hypothetical protein [Gammaproteobacteria bacterium]
MQEKDATQSFFDDSFLDDLGMPNEPTSDEKVELEGMPEPGEQPDKPEAKKLSIKSGLDEKSNISIEEVDNLNTVDASGDFWGSFAGDLGQGLEAIKGLNPTFWDKSEQLKSLGEEAAALAVLIRPTTGSYDWILGVGLDEGRPLEAFPGLQDMVHLVEEMKLLVAG